MIASKMKIRRITVGKSQLSLGRETGIGQWRISLIERGIVPQPNEANLIANALGVRTEDIFIPESASYADNFRETESLDSNDL